MEKNIDELVNRYSEYAAQILELFKSVGAQISDGKLPEAGSSESYAALLSRLEDSYKAVQTYAGQLLNEEEMPAEGSSVEVYKAAILTSEAAKYQEEVKQYSARLKEFLTVTSNMQAFVDVLVPYQDNARRLIDEIESGLCSGPENKERILQELEGPDLFLQSLTYPDFDSEESMEVLGKVFEKYPSMKIQMGISTGKYYLKKAVEEVEIPPMPEAIIPDPVILEEEVVEEAELPEEEVAEEYAEEAELCEEEYVEGVAEAAVDETLQSEEEFTEEAVQPEVAPSEEEIAEEAEVPEEEITEEAELPEEELAEVAPSFCIHCGAKIQPEYRFCIGCGNPIANIPVIPKPVTEEPITADQSFDDYLDATRVVNKPLMNSFDAPGSFENDAYKETESEPAFYQENTDFLTLNEFIIDEKVTFSYFENSYKIYDMHGNVIGAAQQENMSGGAKASRFLLGKGTSQLQKFSLALLNKEGGRVGHIARDGGAMADINIDDENGRRILSTKLRLGAMKDASGNVICKFGVAGLTKRTLKDVNGNILAEIDHRWNGMKSLFTTADKYYIRISPDLTGELRKIVVSAAIAYDLLAGEH